MNKCEKIERFLTDRYQKSDYPVLEWQFKQWSAEKPLSGLRILDATPLFCNTLLKYRSLIAAGANVSIGLSDFISHDDIALDFVKNELMLDVVDGACENQHYDLVMDCAAAYSSSKASIGYVELTKSGVEIYTRKGVPTYVADSSTIKRIETEIGTGDSYFRAMESLGYSNWNGKTIAVFGSGKVGRGILGQAVVRGMVVDVITDINTATDFVHSKARSVIDFRNRDMVDAAVCSSDFTVMATGVENAFEATANVAKAVQSGTILANMGAKDEFGSSVPDSAVLKAKRTLNFILSEPTQIKYIDATMALHNYGAVFLASNRGAAGIINPDKGIEQLMLDISRNNGTIASQIDLFTN